MTGRQRKARIATIGALGVPATLGFAANAHAVANDATVTTTADPGDGDCATNGCTLREAVGFLEDGDTDADRILFQSGVTGTINLTGGALSEINEPLEIIGPGANVLTVNDATNSRVFYVDTAPGSDVTISGLTMTGHSSGSFGGGAIVHFGADLVIRNAAITGSGTTGDGQDGGAIVSSFTGSLTIENSTLSGNTTNGLGSDGGAINSIGDVTVRNSTISGNSTMGTQSHGGGIYMGPAVTSALTVESSTVSGNSADGDGGGISATANGSDPVLENSIVANNSATSTGPDLDGGGGSSFRPAFTLVENTSGAPIIQTVPGSNLLGVDPQLGGLAANGGPTRTHLPAATSPVIDKGSSPLSTDQRGQPRPFDVSFIANSSAAGADASDMGSVERALTAPPASARRCAGRRATLVDSGAIGGTPGPDVIVGSAKADVIRALGARDIVCAGRGRDRVVGGAGNDLLLGQGGGDRLLGRGGRDVLRGGPKRDVLRGGPGRDRLIGGPGRDLLRGGPGRDRQRQ